LFAFFLGDDQLADGTFEVVADVRVSLIASEDKSWSAWLQATNRGRDATLAISFGSGNVGAGSNFSPADATVRVAYVGPLLNKDVITVLMMRIVLFPRLI